MLALAFVAAGQARAGQDYYLLMFASQRDDYAPNYSHTFATFVEANWAGERPCPPSTATLEPHTISWLPRTLEIHTLALCAECGHNFSLKETLHFALATGQRISLWGPYRIEPELYHRALRRIDLLESGRVRYKANDTGRDSDRVSNCIHAVSAAVDQVRVCVGSPGWGEPASYAVLRRFRPWILDEGDPHYWVSSALGLDDFPLIYRDRRSPRTGLLLGPLQSALGRVPPATYGPPP